MALVRLRRASRTVAVLLLASFWSLSHWAGDDVCTADLLQTHDESKHVIGASVGIAPQHCAVCHSVRTPRRPTGPATHLRSPLAAGPVVDPGLASSGCAPVLENLPARAPPATLI